MHPLSIVEARAIGVMRMHDEDGIDDTIIAVSVRDPAVNHDYDHSELPLRVMREARRFFEDDKILEHKEVVVEDFLGPDDAVRIPRVALDLDRRLRRGALPQRI